MIITINPKPSIGKRKKPLNKWLPYQSSLISKIQLGQREAHSMNFVLGTRRIPEKAKRVVVLVQNQIGEARFGAELFRDVLKLSVFLKPPPSSAFDHSGICRRQQFLIRSLGGGIDHSRNMQQDLRSVEVDAESVIRSITPALDPTRHKGQAGKIAVIGGCREYTGAPYFAAISALKIGADLSHVFCTKDAAPVIKSYSSELIVHPVLEESYSVREEDKKTISCKVLAEVDKWMERFDCLVIGPGLGRDPFLLDCVSEIMRHARQTNVPIVIDGDGLFLVTNNIDLVSGYGLAVLTPNVNEYKRLVEKVLSSEVNDVDATQQVLSLAKKIGGVTILKKGKSDLISDGDTVKSVSIYGSPRRCGGQGDILSGSVAVFLSWARQHIIAANPNSNLSCKNPAVLGCIAGSAMMRKAASLAFCHKKRSTVTGDIIECLGESLEDICPAT